MSRRDSGYALLTALLVIFLVSISLALLATSIHLRLRTTLDDSQRVVLSALCDAALAEGLAHLAQSADFAGAAAHDFADGRIASRIEPLGFGIYRVTATATYQGRERVVEAEVVRSPGAAGVRRWRRIRG